MFTRTRKYLCRGVVSLAALALLATNVHAQVGGQPVFPGFPNANTPAGAGVYQPFSPLVNTVNPGAATNAGLYPPTPFYPYYYQMDPVGSYLYGQSAVVGSVGQFQMNRETAQVLHQMALQKQIETTKMMFDLKRYIKENTPTFTDEQIRIAEETLKRIIKNAAPAEVWNGKALNVLLKDLKEQPDVEKYGGKGMEVPEKILRQLNITFGDNGNLGLLKDKGQFEWPIALLDENLLPKEQRDAISIQAEQLVTKAMNGSRDAKTYMDLKANIDSIREKLATQVLKIPTPEYMQAKRFLENFNDALFALNTPKVAQAYLDYQNFIRGGKTVQQLVKYLKDNGLSFAPASPGDEAAYEVLYSGLADYDLTFNTQLVSGSKKQQP